MPMTVVVTRDVAERFRGFLTSCMLEIAPGVYTAPRMSPAVRERVWSVLADWFHELGGGSIVMTWRDPQEPAGQQVATLGTPPVKLAEHEGTILTVREPRAAPEEPSTAPPALAILPPVPSEGGSGQGGPSVP